MSDQFISKKVTNCSIFINKLLEQYTNLNNLATPITNNRLALQVLHGLSFDYRSMEQYLKLLPSFDSLCSMLKLGEHTNNKDNSSSQDSILVTTRRPQNSELLEHFDSKTTTNQLVVVASLIVVDRASTTNLNPESTMDVGIVTLNSPLGLHHTVHMVLAQQTSHFNLILLGLPPSRSLIYLLNQVYLGHALHIAFASSLFLLWVISYRYGSSYAHSFFIFSGL